MLWGLETQKTMAVTAVRKFILAGNSCHYFNIQGLPVRGER